VTAPASVVRVGCAGWSLPRAEQHRFPEEGTHLARYAQALNAVEINSSFYRPHRVSTYAKWAASVPESFRFSVKVPKTITHAQRLVDAGPLLDAFLAECAGLGARLGCLLVQLPPSLDFRAADAAAFYAALRHATWFTPEADALLREARVGRVAADPPRVPDGDLPGGWPGVEYYRLHGSPRIYYSNYEAEYLAALAERLQAGSAAGRTMWCIFDNTALGAATANALDVHAASGGRRDKVSERA
jgi:uncharacterized protein YecE (DUF72 family)